MNALSLVIPTCLCASVMECSLTTTGIAVTPAMVSCTIFRISESLDNEEDEDDEVGCAEINGPP